MSKENITIGNNNIKVLVSPSRLISRIEKIINKTTKAKVKEPYKTKLPPKEKPIKANTSIAKKAGTIAYFDNLASLSLSDMRILYHA